jgi:hypothetical protein
MSRSLGNVIITEKYIIAATAQYDNCKYIPDPNRLKAPTPITITMEATNDGKTFFTIAINDIPVKPYSIITFIKINVNLTNARISQRKSKP